MSFLDGVDFWVDRNELIPPLRKWGVGKDIYFGQHFEKKFRNPRKPSKTPSQGKKRARKPKNRACEAKVSNTRENGKKRPKNPPER